MRRTLMFLLALAVPLALMGWIHGTMTQAQDDVVLEPIVTIGDPAVMEGQTVTMEIWCGENMKWLTDFTPGAEPKTEYSFVQERQGSSGRSSRFGLYVSGGSNASTSGGFKLGEKGMGKLVQAVADQTLPGQTHSTTVRIEDYMDYYELYYEAYIKTDDILIDQQFEGYLERDSYHAGDQEVYEQWAERFRFPVIPGHEMNVTVTKNAAGNITDISYGFANGDMGASIVGCGTKRGVYLSPWYTDLNYQPLSTGEFPEGCGIYFVPYKEGTSGGNYNDTRDGFDFDGLRLVLPMEPGDRVVNMKAEEKAGLLHMILEVEGRFVYSRLNMVTSELEGWLDIGTEYSSNFQYFFGEGVYLLNGEDTLTLVNIREEPKVEFSMDRPDYLDIYKYDDLRYEDGKLYLVGRIWGDDGMLLVTAMCDQSGVGFYGEYKWEKWRADIPSYGCRPELEDSWFAE